MKKIPVGGDKYVAWVDDEDYERVVAAGPWFAKRQFHHLVYAQANIRKPDGSWSTVLMHTLITGFRQADHRTHALASEGVIDNRRSNLRDGVRYNSRNARKAEGCSSEHKGVYWSKQRCKWRAQITVDRKKLHLGYFANEQDAARAYNEAAKKYFGEFALLNAGV